jgi:class I fructose-bisphosphate aldolase
VTVGIQTHDRPLSTLEAIWQSDDVAELLSFKSPKIPSSQVHLPGPEWLEKVFIVSDRPARVLTSLQRLLGSGRLAGTGYVSILPVDQGIEHSAGASFAPEPIYFDPENIITLALEGGCNAVASTLGVLGACARKYAYKIPFILKLNHNELISYPNAFDQIKFANVKQAFDMGAMGVGATIYFGSAESRRQIQEITDAFHMAHEMGMFTVLWCYLRNADFDDVEQCLSFDLTGQANHLGVTIQADIIKQKLPAATKGYPTLAEKIKSINPKGKYGKTHKKVYSDLASDHPIDLARYQVANCYLGRAGLINSGGESKGESDLLEAVRTAIINKRAGGMGLISGRKAFQRPMKQGIEILNAIQDVYLSKDVTVA